jgi:uncharacterized protein
MYDWGDNRRYNSYVNYFTRKFGGRVQKISIDAGFTCPNRDGTLGTTGCIFCNNLAFSPSYCDPSKSISQQIDEGMAFHKKRYKNTAGYLAYFQAFSNTYAAIETLCAKYHEALSKEGIMGLVIGTRPDCINDDVLAMLQTISEKHYVVVEYGVESCYNQTLKLINRGHTFEKSVEAIEKTAAYNINVGAHMIFGLPGETRGQMLKEAEILSRLPLNAIKFHQLQIIKDTPLASQFLENPMHYNLFELEDYLEFMVAFTENLKPDIVIERIAGEAPPYTNISTIKWGLRNDELIARFEKKLQEKNTWQGRLYKKH